MYTYPIVEGYCSSYIISCVAIPVERELTVKKVSAKTMKIDILILVWLFVSAKSQTAEYYIIASSAFCPTKSCLTLSQFTTNSSNYLDVNSNVVLVLQPGSHKLDLEIRFQNLDHIGLLSNGSDQNEPTSVTINCRWPARFGFGAVEKVHIRGLAFIECYTHYFALASQLTIESCRFQNHTGSALQITDSTVKITGTSFISNSFGTFHYGYVSPVFKNKWVGGAIMTTWTNVTINDSVFVDNHAEIGGAVFGEYFSNISFFNVTFEANNANCSSRCNGGALYSEGGSNVTVFGSKFISNVAAYGGVFAHTSTTLSIDQSFFAHNLAENGGAIFVWNYYRSDKGNLSITESSFVNNTASNGAVLKSFNFACPILHSYFDENHAGNNGGVMMALEAKYKVINCTFTHNSAKVVGAVLIAQDSQITVNKSLFFANIAQFGGCMSIVTSNVSTDECQFIINVAIGFGGVIYLDRHRLEITNSVFSLNIADDSGYGGVLYVMDDSIFIVRNVMITNNTAVYGMIHLSQSAGHFAGNNLIFGNNGPLSLYYSNVTFHGTTTFISSTSNGTSLDGGAITAFQSNIVFEGRVNLMFNNADNGGALHATNSKLYILGSITISNNTATDSGGGIYLYQSELKCMQGSNIELLGNRAAVKGGGIYTIGSVISVEYSYFDVFKLYSGSRTSFIENTAGTAGGGIYFESNAKLNILMFSGYECDNPEFALTFVANSANLGGAIYVADDTYPSVCTSLPYKVSSVASDCFLQTLALNNLLAFTEHCATIMFNYNFDYEHGCTSNLYGGLLDRCTVRSFGSIQHYGTTDGLTYLTSISNNTNITSIHSDVTRVCFCKNNQSDCDYNLPPFRVKKGETFLVPLVAIDQVNHLVSATVLSSLKTNESGIGEGQLIQGVCEVCTDLIFNVFSPHDFEELTLYARGPCMDSELSQKQIQIHFLPCACPVGFQVRDTETTRCVCDCDSRLDTYITNCDPVNGVLIREGNFWITDINNSQFNTYDYLIYPNCPLDYCHPPSLSIRINLSAPNGADAQCVNGHSGILCGTCKPGLSMSIGSSHCIPCSSNWILVLTISLIVASLGGILLVVVLLGLNLTVATGSLNGIIFYANVINSNCNTFLPFKKRNFITVFLAWSNLDLGFDMCFFEGMDAYWKTLLQLLFPLYLILLVIIIILISEHSSRFARVIGRRNPVVTLATLILLSYAKLLNFITVSLSFATLVYPDGSREVVWLPDASVSYLQGKHIALLLIALPILIVGSIYTFLLLSWQWLLQYQDKRAFRWVKNQTLYMFLEPYHAPYTFKHRYWTGLLLLVRSIIIIISATNASNDPRINLLAGGITTTSLLLLKGCLQGNRIYRKRFIDLVEMTCYVNIALLALTELFTLGGNENRTTAAYISGSVTFALFLLVITIHICTELISRSVVWKYVKQCRQRPRDIDDSEEIIDLLSAQQEVTQSEVPAPVKGELPLTALIEAGHKDENAKDQEEGDSGSDADLAHAGSSLNTLPSDLQ